MEIKTIKEEVSTTIIEKKSKFIAYIFGVDSQKDIKDKLDRFHKEYADSTHICYGYIVNDGGMLYKSFDDGEPSQTAGAPILNVLMKNNIVNAMIVVIRYFGGIKLGAGGLTRTYSSAASEVFKLASVVTLKSGIKAIVESSYDKANDIKRIIEKNGFSIEKERYDLNVTYEFVTESEEKLNELLFHVNYLGCKLVSKEEIMVRM